MTKFWSCTLDYARLSIFSEDLFFCFWNINRWQNSKKIHDDDINILVLMQMVGMNFMSIGNVAFQISTVGKVTTTNITCKRFLPWWTEAICFFKMYFLPKLASQVSHLNGFLPSWTVAICLFILLQVLFDGFCQDVPPSGVFDQN